MNIQNRIRKYFHNVYRPREPAFITKAQSPGRGTWHSISNASMPAMCIYSIERRVDCMIVNIWARHILGRHISNILKQITLMSSKNCICYASMSKKRKCVKKAATYNAVHLLPSFHIWHFALALETEAKDSGPIFF